MVKSRAKAHGERIRAKARIPLYPPGKRLSRDFLNFLIYGFQTPVFSLILPHSPSCKGAISLFEEAYRRVSSTGQWSLPVTEVRIRWSATRSISRSETRK